MHTLADGVSSCNNEEVAPALEGMRQAGCTGQGEHVVPQLQGGYVPPHFNMCDTKVSVA